MRILAVTSQFPIQGEPNRGRPLYQTLHALSELAEVRVLSPVARYPAWAMPRSYRYQRSDDSFQVPGCDVRYVDYPALPMVSRPFNGAACARSLHRELAAFAPDVVLGYWLYPDAYGAMRAAQRAGLPLVVGARGSDLRVRDRISRALTRPVLRHAARILTVSEDLAKVAVRDYAADPSRIRVIGNGCDAGIFHPQDRRAARASLGLRQDQPLLLYVGRLVVEKGLRELLHAARALAARIGPLQLAFVGDGALHGELAAAGEAQDGVTLLLPGAQPPVDVARWMAAADLVSLPSWSEGHPNVLVEALACGRPVVATDVGGIPEVVDAHSGLLVPVGDVCALTRALQEVLASTWDSQALARRFSRSWQEVATDTLHACEEAMQLHHKAMPASSARAIGEPSG